MSSSPSEGRKSAWPAWLTALQQITPESAVPEVLTALERGLGAEGHWLARLSNTVALLRRYLPDLFSAGFYITARPGTHLWLGPYQGPPTFAQVEWGDGAVGSAANERAVQIIAQLRRFPNYVPAYRAIRSEIALPLVRDRMVLGVLDATSEAEARFGIVEAEFLSLCAERIVRAWPQGSAGIP